MSPRPSPIVTDFVMDDVDSLLNVKFDDDLGFNMMNNGLNFGAPPNGQQMPPMPHQAPTVPRQQPGPPGGGQVGPQPGQPPKREFPRQQAPMPGGRIARSPGLGERIKLLLGINNELIRQIATSPAGSANHMECMKRMEANLNYLHGLAEDSAIALENARVNPIILKPPPDVPSLVEPYRRLALTEI